MTTSRSSAGIAIPAVTRGEAAVAMISGAGTQLGAQIATHLSAAGWLIVATDTTRTWGDVDLGFEVAVRDHRAMRAATQATVTELGPPALLVTVNDAPESTQFMDVTAADWSALLDTVVGRAFTAARAVVPVMCEHHRGTLIAVSPAPPGASQAGVVHYAAAHHTLIGLMRTLAIEVAADGVNVTTVAPIVEGGATARSSDQPDPVLAGVIDTIAYLTGDGGFCTGGVMSPHVRAASL